MLRVTPLQIDGIPTLRLEGKLVGPWVGELRAICEKTTQDSNGCPLRLDLAGVSFIDAEGIELLERLLRQGATLAAASNFVAELLHGPTSAQEGARP